LIIDGMAGALAARDEEFSAAMEDGRTFRKLAPTDFDFGVLISADCYGLAHVILRRHCSNLWAMCAFPFAQ